MLKEIDIDPGNRIKGYEGNTPEEVFVYCVLRDHSPKRAFSPRSHTPSHNGKRNWGGAILNLR